MKILHVLNAYLPEHIAGTEVYVAALVRTLQQHQIESVILIPNSKNEYEEYYYESIKIIKYAESSIADRAIIAGLKAPNGLQNFIAVVKKEVPQIVHFHELADSIGIGIFHVKAVKALGVKILMTLHLAKYSCRTGTLMYMNQSKCDGIIKKYKCSKCWLNNMGVHGLKASLITAAFTLTNIFRIETRALKNSIGTVLAFPQIIEESRKKLLLLQSLTDTIIVLTKWYEQILINNGIAASHLKVIEQGIPNKFESKDIASKNNAVLKLIFIGRINHFKGVDLLIESVKQIDANAITLDIYGAATDEQYFKKCIQLCDGATNIVFKGNVAPHLVIPTIAQYDVLCIPSMVAEMGPLVLREAFAAGVPVLASNVYGNAEQVVHNENGWLFTFNSKESLTTQLKLLLQNTSLVEKATSTIKPVRNFDVVASEHVHVYQKVLQSL